MVKSLYEEFDDLISVVNDLGFEGEEAENFIAVFIHYAIESIRGEIDARNNKIERNKV